MPWKDVYCPTEEEMKTITKRAREVKSRSFNSSHTRESKELNQQIDCKITTEKKLTKDRRNIYNHILDEDRERNKPKKSL